MGLRGPGAKPISRPQLVHVSEEKQTLLFAPPKPPKQLRRRRHPWEKRGLSKADRVIAFVETLHITSGMLAGQRFKLRDWQKDIIRAIYDPVRADGRRRVRTALITMGRKNGKTQLVAALALAHLCGPVAESRGQVYSAAADRDQAALIFAEMEAMILADATLIARVNIQRFAKRIEDATTGSVYSALSSDARKAHGLSASFVVYDEIAQAPDRHLFDNLVTSTGARSEPLVIVISTQSSDPHHVMSELTAYGRQVRDGVLQDPSFAPFIFEVPIEADAFDEKNWYLANPGLGDFRSLDEMRTMAEMAKRLPAREAAFRALYLNQPIDAEARFIAAADWRACNGPVDVEQLCGRPCWAGLDLSSTRDLTALVLYFPDDQGAVLPFFWVPGDNLADREDRDRVPYRTWRDRGFIEAPTGRAIDRCAIVRRLASIAATFDVRGIAFDRWRMEDMNKLLSDEGIELPFTAYGQGFRDMGPAVDALETAILARRLRHGGHPVLQWNAANAVIELDPAGARKISKRRSIERVDGLVALAMALGLYNRELPETFYRVDGPMVISA